MSPNTNYGVYFIFHLVDQDFQPRNLQWMLERAQRREDGWMEVEITDFFSGDGYNLVDFHYKLKNNDLRSYCCLIVEGVEFRPKNLWMERKSFYVCFSSKVLLWGICGFRSLYNFLHALGCIFVFETQFYFFLFFFRCYPIIC